MPAWVLIWALALGALGVLINTRTRRLKSANYATR
jgi:hypothetical protein